MPRTRRFPITDGLRRLVPLPAILTAGVVAAGCTGSDASRAFSVRDSAGVRVVEYAAPPDSATTALGPSPTLSLGAAEGDDVVLFQRILNVVRFADGAVFVADGGSQEIRGFSATGEHLVTFGGRGGGPGEFNFLGDVFAVGEDSIGALDTFVRTVKVFDRSGAFGRSFRLAALAPSVPQTATEHWQQPFPAGFTRDGSLVLRADRAEPDDPEAEIKRNPRRVTVLAPGAGTAVVLGTFPGFQAAVGHVRNRTVIMPLTMGGESMVAVGGATVAVVTTDGTVRRVLTTPADFTPKQADPGFVTGIARDELGVEYVRVYAVPPQQ